MAQKQPDGDWKPVVFSSRALTSTEQRYAQIEKEALAITWACERLVDYLVGRTSHVETDHKPLVPLLASGTSMKCPQEYNDCECASYGLTSRSPMYLVNI